MTTLNDIPDDLKEPQQPDDWTAARGLVTGSLCVAIAVTILATAAYWVTRSVPLLTGYWLLAIGEGFVVTWILFALMHKNAGVVWDVQIPIVLAGAACVVAARYLGYLEFIAVRQEPPVSAWSLFRPSEFLLLHLTTWFGAALATLACKDGDGIASAMADLAMTNPLTGRRV
jgi:hypothetical protein